MTRVDRVSRRALVRVGTACRAFRACHIAFLVGICARAAGLAQALGGVIVGLVCARGTVVVVVVVFCCGCVAGKEEKV